MKTVYLAGAIAGVNNYKEIFGYWERCLLQNGHEVVNPCKLPHDHDKKWRLFMNEDIIALVACDSIAMIPGWHDSKGARVEHSLALGLDMEVIYL